MGCNANGGGDYDDDDDYDYDDGISKLTASKPREIDFCFKYSRLIVSVSY